MNSPTASTKRPALLRILNLDACPEEASRTLAALDRPGLPVEAEVTADRQRFLSLLNGPEYDVVLSEVDLGGWTAFDVLEILRNRRLETPLILVARYSTDEALGQLLAAGVSDVVYKDRLSRLAYSVERAVRESRLRQSQARAETALGSANQVLTALIRCAPLPITVIDHQGTVNVWNPAAEEVLGWSRDEVLGSTLTRVMGKRTGLARLLERSLHEGGVIGEETAQPRKDGATVDLRVFCAPLTDDDGENRGVIGMLTDITERNLIIEAFRESKERFQSAFVYAPIGMAIGSLDGRILRVNPAVCRMLGYREADLLRMNWKELALTDSPAAIEPRDADSSQPTELLLRHKSGRAVCVQWNVSLVRDAGGRPQYQLCQLVDITESRHAREQIRRYAENLERSNQDLQHFAYVASHDLQEPLRMVRGFMELLARRYEGKLGEDADEYIRYAVDGATRMQNLIRGLLAYSRVGTQGKQFEPVDASAALSQAMLNLQAALTETQAVVTHDSLPTVPADDVQLAQLFQNLIGNAVKFRSGQAPSIHVGVSGQNGTWRFAVKDNGIGFDPEHANRIFQMFQRLHGQGKYSGTGIGLALCKRIVERHGGRIWVDSAPGEGSTFHFTLSKEAASAS